MLRDSVVNTLLAISITYSLFNIHYGFKQLHGPKKIKDGVKQVAWSLDPWLPGVRSSEGHPGLGRPSCLQAHAGPWGARGPDGSSGGFVGCGGWVCFVGSPR
jgi:hypothetical protein